MFYIWHAFAIQNSLVNTMLYKYI